MIYLSARAARIGANRQALPLRSFSIAVPARKEGDLGSPKPRGFLAEYVSLSLPVSVTRLIKKQKRFLQPPRSRPRGHVHSLPRGRETEALTQPVEGTTTSLGRDGGTYVSGYH